MNIKSWRRTKVSWESKKIIWESWALGGTETDTVAYFELHEDKYPKGPFNRHTINKVRKELLDLPLALLQKLVNELPEIQGFLEEKRPEYLGQIEQIAEPLSKHSSELTITALTIASNLEKYRNAPSFSLGDPFGHTVYTVGEMVYGGWWREEDKAKLGDVDRKAAANLLSHLKEEGEFPELAEIQDWSELNDTQITENFIQRLISRAHRRNFKGACPVCSY